jgi:hypothetical protein
MLKFPLENRAKIYKNPLMQAITGFIGILG